MVDYVSVGHFEIFDRLVKQSKLFGVESTSEKSVSLLQEIQMTTEIILDFNDKYISTDDLEALIIDLASLGKTFVRRFAEEDKLVDLLHSANVSSLIGGEKVKSKSQWRTKSPEIQGFLSMLQVIPQRR
jgi:regulator of sigma D